MFPFHQCIQKILTMATNDFLTATVDKTFLLIKKSANQPPNTDSITLRILGSAMNKPSYKI